MSKRILFLIVLIITSCNDQEKKSKQDESIIAYKPDSIALRFNNKAARLMGNVSAFNGDSLNNLLYDSAIVYLDLAIEIDSLYLFAYTNKAEAFRRKGSLEEAVQVLNQVETIKPGFAEGMMGQAFILEKMGKLELAEQKYRQALKVFEGRLENAPENIKAQSDIAFLYIFLEDKNKALDEIRNLILENPESQELKMMEKMIKDFDRKKFIEQY